ncbi:MAG: cysteine--tRNA ligase [bacterium]
MTIRLYNTLKRHKENFVPQDPNRVTMYVCGPTVYNFAHIGNARPYVVYDMLYRLLKISYPTVVYARNITDVDDKINQAASDQGVEIGVITKRFAHEFRQDMRSLGVLDPDIEPHATAHIPQIIQMIETLIEDGFAYEQDGHVLFDVTSYDEYGHLSGRNLDEMRAGARVAVADYKKNPGDFVMWKPSDEQQPGWESPWGRGRPGWHIECSAMSEHHLGKTLDIHGGGRDLIFPHHENEIAQSTCAHHGTQFVRYWLHNDMLTFGNEKMSKSLGNVVRIRQLLEQYPGELLRFLLISTHYRKPLEWTDKALSQARSRLDRLYGVLRDLKDVEAVQQPVMPEIIQSLSDDINTAEALMHLTELTCQAHNTKDNGQLAIIKGQILSSGKLLGLLQQDPEVWFQGDVSDSEEATEIEALIKQRNQARSDKNFALSDQIRDDLLARGVILEDGADGTRWRKES